MSKETEKIISEAVAILVRENQITLTEQRRVLELLRKETKKR